MGCDLVFRMVDKDTKESVILSRDDLKMRGSSNYTLNDLRCKLDRVLDDIAFDNGFYTDEERAEIRTAYHEGFYFRGRVDNCDTVEVFTPERYTENQLATAIACYISGFMLWHWKKLNGFPGIAGIKWDIKKGRPDGH